jgi:tetratricopeptide (TPR) repeat protein
MANKQMIVRNKNRIITVAVVLVLLFLGCAKVPVMMREKPWLEPAEIPPAVKALFESAEDAFENGRTDDALALYDQILAGSPEASSLVLLAHVRKGAIYAARGDDEKVVAELEDVTGRFPGDPLYNEARFYLARAYLRLMRYDAAAALIPDLLTEEIPRSRRGQLHSLMGDTFFGQGLSYEAFREYVTALNEKPDEAVAIHCKTNMEDIAIHYLTLAELEELSQTYTHEYPAGYLLYALARAMTSGVRKRHLKCFWQGSKDTRITTTPVSLMPVSEKWNW